MSSLLGCKQRIGYKRYDKGYSYVKRTPLSLLASKMGVPPGITAFNIRNCKCMMNKNLSAVNNQLQEP